MDIVIDIHDGVVLEPCPCCGSPAQPLRVENALDNRLRSHLHPFMDKLTRSF